MRKNSRERTGLGHDGLQESPRGETDGDLEKAIEELRKKSALKAAKKAGRTTADGLLGLKVAEDGSRGAIVEVNIETDFAAKNEKFIAFVAKTLDLVYASEDGDVKAILEAGLDAEREALVQEIGENIAVRRAAVVASTAGGVASYLHGDNRKGTLVVLSGANDELGRDVAMHVTAINPLVVTADQVPADTLAKESARFTLPRPRTVANRRTSSKRWLKAAVRKYLAEVSLVDQPFVKDPNQKVGALAKAAGVEVEQFCSL